MKIYYLNKSNKLQFYLASEARNGFTKNIQKGLSQKVYSLDNDSPLQEEKTARLKYERWLNPNNLTKTPSLEEINDYLVKSTRLYLTKKENVSEKPLDFEEVSIANLIIGPPVLQKLWKEKGVILEFDNIFSRKFYIGLTLDNFY